MSGVYTISGSARCSFRNRWRMSSRAYSGTTVRLRGHLHSSPSSAICETPTYMKRLATKEKASFWRPRASVSIPAGGLPFRPEIVPLVADTRDAEQVVAVTPVGYTASTQSPEERLMTRFGRTHRRKPLEEMVRGIEETRSWVKPALHAARLAPSVVKRQSWWFNVTQDAVTVSADNLKDTYNIPNRLDSSIAMLHLEIGALRTGVRSAWELLAPPQVARFTVRPGTA